MLAILVGANIELEPGAKPRHARPYPVPVIHLEALKKKLMHLCEIGVLSPQGASEWASPTFITPKKMVESVRSVT